MPPEGYASPYIAPRQPVPLSANPHPGATWSHFVLKPHRQVHGVVKQPEHDD